MKKPLLIVIIILVVILALPVINLLRWTFQTKKPLDIIIVDKTVPTLEREKHKSFNWILTNERFVKQVKKSSYSSAKDYFGFKPLRPAKNKKFDKGDYRLNEVLDSLNKNGKAVYFTDTYGVFFNDWYQGINKSRRSRILFGGMNNNDNALIGLMQDSNKLVVLEYNAFDYPTNEYYAFRTQEKLGITWSKWTGKYFSTLDTVTDKDFPIWMTAMYRKQYRKPWTFSKPGIVLVRDRYIIVLEEGTQLKNAIPYIVTDPAYVAKWNLTDSISFYNWFDIINPAKTNVISKFKLATTAAGDSLLAGYEGLSKEFPAVIQNLAEPNTYYFSGDFTNTDIPVWTARFKGVEKLKGLLYSKKPEDERRFFWLYYKPLVSGIFNDYYNSLQKNN
jgi:hypothetical protein